MTDSPWGPPPPNQDPRQPQQPQDHPDEHAWQRPQGGNPYAGPTTGHPYAGPATYGGGHLPGAVQDPDRRPATVTAAAVITFVCAGTSALLLGLTAIGLLVAREALADEITRQLESDPAFRDVEVPSAGELAAVLAVVMAVLAVWCLLACVFAFLAMRRSNAGRVLLVISAAVTALLSLLMILSFVTAITLVASVAVIVLLFAGGASDWYAHRTPQDHQPPPGPTHY